MLCIGCAGTHRAIGVHLSFVRSSTLDKWKPHQLHRVVLGGNAAADAALASVRALPPVTRYASPVAQAYAKSLTERVEAELGAKPAELGSAMSPAQSAAFHARFANATAISSADINGDPQPSSSNGCACCVVM
ncbi:uncharacterized protein AMSG_02801 [Thecamonas trahens ATCC 50062]|uniref:Arf-GAP domain-containing protein n=1 Tax=Thecamonas trahens ATCC 50062 TaxID=461836 RepID=A0A0L0D1W7_THETB|nr:hypothetical protein AMSG_02801 [Thecamonas trahens ATCC 50062]KNC46349.1 hypothetical protein AMSG_02801 [Thecamonas trahens ATCC 50062]|eukprot:XP_013760642.1 hypothetical protein AMSG_02801 [Thecamonas trahens ATCC 50062]